MILESSELGGQLGSIQAGLSWQSWAGPQADTQGGGQGRKAKQRGNGEWAQPGQGKNLGARALLGQRGGPRERQGKSETSGQVYTR